MKRLPVPPSERNLARARAVLAAGCLERASELGRPEPTDLAGACKFASLFAQALFGGELRGNREHQWLEHHGRVIDLTDAAGLVSPYPYRHDPSFWGNPEHAASLESCRRRVSDWARHFYAEATADGTESPG